jgi:hypothetical protein
MPGERQLVGRNRAALLPLKRSLVSIFAHFEPSRFEAEVELHGREFLKTVVSQSLNHRERSHGRIVIIQMKSPSHS